MSKQTDTILADALGAAVENSLETRDLWWLEEQAVSAANGGSIQPETAAAEAVLAAVGPLAAKTVITATEGMRGGSFTCTDANGTIVNLSDTVTPSNVHLHTMQGSSLYGHARGNDEFNISSATHHAVYGSVINVGGGDNKVTIQASSWAGPNMSLDQYASENGYGFGMVNSVLQADSANSLNLSMYAYIGGIYGTHSPGATAVVGSSGADTIRIGAGKHALVKTSMHSGAGDDFIEIWSPETAVWSSQIHMGSGNDTMIIRGWGNTSGRGRGIVHDSVLMTGTGNDYIELGDLDADGSRRSTYVMDESYILLGPG